MISSTPRPHFTPGKDPVPSLQEAGWAPGPIYIYILCNCNCIDLKVTPVGVVILRASSHCVGRGSYLRKTLHNEDFYFVFDYFTAHEQKSVSFFKNQSLQLAKKFQLTLVCLSITSEHFTWTLLQIKSPSPYQMKLM